MLKHYKSNKFIGGCDEAGRGCLAGPVFAACVILPRSYSNKTLNDSKKILSSKTREALRIEIEEVAIDYGVAQLNHRQIDRYNILNASFLAMHKAVNKLKTKPDLLLIDGNRFKDHPNIDHECIIKGDGIYYSIAAASILAKTYRDQFMQKLSQKFPEYGWQTNKGYPTKAHREALIKSGPTPYHRKSFRLYPNENQGKLFE